jgi:signal transduction histidine kinase
LEPLACSGLDEAAWKETRANVRSQAVLDGGEVVVIPDLRNHRLTSAGDFPTRNGLNAYVGVPLKAKGERLGVIGFYARERPGFSNDDIDLITTLAGQTAVAILNSRVHQRLKRAHAALEETLEIKSVLVGVMAHELKTPIQIMLGSAELLAAGLCGELNADQLERIQAIEAGGNELLALIKSALDMARLEHGKMPLAVTQVSVSELFAELKSESESGFREKGIELDIPLLWPGLTITTDKVKLKEILRNLLDNARKYTMSGKVSVEFTQRDDSKVEFCVRDTGIGISNESLPKIFDMFYTTAKDHAAAGLGLNIVKRLVLAMSGQIEVSSEVGKGTVFRVILPTQVS